MLKIVLYCLAPLPLRSSRTIGKFLGWLNYKMKTRISLVTEANIQLCFPKLDKAEQQKLILSSLMNTGQTMMETPAVWLSGLERSRKWIIKVEHEYLLDEALAAGKGVVVILPHHGNWEMYNVYTAARDKHMTALYKPPEQDSLKPLMRSIRENYGNELVPTTIKGIATLYKRLNSGGQVTVLPDQVPASGKFANFYGQEALTDILISRMLKKTEAAVICCVVVRSGAGFTVRFSKPDEDIISSDVNESLKAMNSSIEKSIDSEIDQYQWGYKRFRQRPSGERKIYKFGKRAAQYHA